MHRDFEVRIHPLFFTTPVPRAAYLGGRYLAAVAANLLVLLGIPWGLLAATLMPFVDGDRIGAFRPLAYVLPFLLIVVPNVLMTAAVFLVLAALTRRVLANQVGGLALLLAWSLSRLFATAIDADWITWLSDPFGAAPHEPRHALLDGGGAERHRHARWARPCWPTGRSGSACRAGRAGVRHRAVPLRAVRPGGQRAADAPRGDAGAVAGGAAADAGAAPLVRRGRGAGAAVRP